MQTVIRTAEERDLGQLLEMEQGLIRDERPYDPTIRPDPVQYYDLPAMLKDPDTHLVVADAGGRIVSCGYAARRSPRHYLDHEAYALFGFMYTLPEFRGQGLNGKVMEVLKIWARARGLNEIRLTVYAGNQPAIRAYEKAGFTSHIVEMRLGKERK
ncbi:GNAT family N-acetyltransferase [Robiginitalea sediminis]|uniref:GNAT family N-acetyltransferase n=1 Tax=Robiginitalea sediminis TaxID=1982593 RepID=UPI000B4AA684|nr:GNAT family N-acetyltransferase [Robiginitalea sediminis]